jgi:hypothetical protein
MYLRPKRIFSIGSIVAYAEGARRFRRWSRVRRASSEDLFIEARRKCVLGNPKPHWLTARQLPVELG